VSRLDRDIAEGLARERLVARARRLVSKWAPRLGVRIDEIHVKRMRSFWASINERARRMWIAPELAEQPPAVLEYTIVHELVHMLTDGHDAKFYRLMDRHLPGWRKVHRRCCGKLTPQG
jgi:predicted metal-dependent hydrolase